MNELRKQWRALRRTIGKNIQRERSYRKMPLHKLAQLTGISEKQLDYYELGKSEIQLMELLSIAEALGMQTLLLMKKCYESRK